ncbi:MAG: hypothetical protein IT331_10105 [Anaerolineae bacterium]|nr:hypothetical protein [Anaerolineae bacterium]
MMNWDPDDRAIPPMSAEMFSTLVVSRLRAIEHVEIIGGKGLALSLRVRGKDTTAQLERAYARYRTNPEAVSPIIDLYIDNLVNGENVERAGNENFAAVRELLLPRLMTARQWMDRREDGLRLVIRALADDVGEGLVIDRGEELEYVQVEMISVWEIDSQSAFDAAQENLARLAVNAPYLTRGEGEETLLMDHSPNAAARVLLSERMQEWQARVGGELLVGLPTHDLMLGFARTHPAFQELRAQVAEDAAASPNGLLGTLLRPHQGAIELFT